MNQNQKLRKLCALRILGKSDGQKCERCWHWETDIGQNPGHPTICGRCVEAVKQFELNNQVPK